MKRTFATTLSHLTKQKPADLRSTLKFLTQAGKGTTLTSLFENGKTEASHIKHIVDVLNNDLPDVELNKKRVDAHYDILMSRLKHVVEKSISGDDLSGARTAPGTSSQLSFQEKFARCHTSESLYSLLLELQVAHKLSRVAMAKIVMNRNFTHLKQVSENLPGFSHEVELAVMVGYRLRDADLNEIYKTYSSRWTDEWHNLTRIAQNLVWKSDHRLGGIAAVTRRMHEIKDWSSADIISLYQALYSVAHQLPVASSAELTKVQQLFVAALRALSRAVPTSEQAKKNCFAVVRASLENKLSAESSNSSEAGASVFQYRFMRRLDDLLQLSARDARLGPDVGTAIQGVLDSLHREEEQARSQMVLKFI
ncbi:Smt1p [Lachancea thermotolerans CBS 6340]|uniref:KLTH0F05390p n=1 Tax=Lachancea thermotolerans (strain ATCC 56472 / CBS 6340 / NRRL Y-8284) TaxID=559295 RepID=C5DKK1_LACTC|nr:KLTH0F05390p [Lachancea thermotolerans CBS 6340]CAR24002.1 KLTH0F05390p [Lachancea thermotolerans CBS 6340]